MINSIELRFNNFVKYEGEIKQIKSMWDFDYIDDFYPIPLTKELLLTCGFVWVDSFKCYVHGYKTEKEFILKQYSDFWLMCDIDLKVVVKYLHQLQNLYFALTNNELKIIL